jgi:hypothetical protein
MLAFAMMAAIRHRANTAPPQKTLSAAKPPTRRRSDGPSRRSAASPPNWPNDRSNRLTSSHGPSGDALTKPSHRDPISNQIRNCDSRPWGWPARHPAAPLWPLAGDDRTRTAGVEPFGHIEHDSPVELVITTVFPVMSKGEDIYHRIPPSSWDLRNWRT